MSRARRHKGHGCLHENETTFVEVWWPLLAGVLAAESARTSLIVGWSRTEALATRSVVGGQVWPDVAIHPGGYLSPDHTYQPESAHLRKAITAFNDLATSGDQPGLPPSEVQSHLCTIE
jgi:hypothetical protein